jgi:hypothetical protein
MPCMLSPDSASWRIALLRNAKVRITLAETLYSRLKMPKPCMFWTLECSKRCESPVWWSVRRRQKYEPLARHWGYLHPRRILSGWALSPAVKGGVAGLGEVGAGDNAARDFGTKTPFGTPCCAWPLNTTLLSGHPELVPNLMWQRAVRWRESQGKMESVILGLVLASPSYGVSCCHIWLQKCRGE